MDGAAAQCQAGIGNDQIGIDALLGAQPVARRAGAERIVEGKQPRLDLRDGEAGDRAGEFLRKHQPLRLALLVRPVGQFGNGDAVGDR